MVSFANQQQVHLAFEKAQGVALDNGAFTVWKKSEKVDVPAYTQWVMLWMRHPAFEWAIIPDVIDGTEGENDDLISQWPLAREVSVPVWHMHESIRKLGSLIESFPRVAIGSSGEFADIRTKALESNARSDGGCLRRGRHAKDKTSWVAPNAPRVLSSVIRITVVDSTNCGRNIGLDERWTGPYVPPSKDVRAMVIRDICENHASAYRWCGIGGVPRNLELLG